MYLVKSSPAWSFVPVGMSRYPRGTEDRDWEAEEVTWYHTDVVKQYDTEKHSQPRLKFSVKK